MAAVFARISRGVKKFGSARFRSPTRAPSRFASPSKRNQIMPDEAVKFGATQRFEMKPPEKKIYGVTTATVLNNFDCTGEARVQLQLPWLPGYTPWARLSSPMAGSSTGSFFVPQVGDEVMVAFNQGDVREPYVLGACWSSADKP